MVASAGAILCEGVCAAASKSRVVMGREHVGQVLPSVVGLSNPKTFRVDASKKELREREMGGGFSRGSAVWKSLRRCVQK